MGQKINPISFRIGGAKNWTARWFFPGKNSGIGSRPYAKFLEEDEAIRNVIWKKIANAGIAGLEIERTSNNLKVYIRAARPGFVIGQGGKGIEELTKAIEATLKKVRGASKARGGKEPHLSVNVEELKRSEVSAQYLAQQIAWDLERRMPFRRTVRKYLEMVEQNKEVKGIKILVGGRLDGAEIARRETLKKGALPLQTLRSDLDYGRATARTTYGAIGIKVWIYRGEYFEKKAEDQKPRGRK